MIESKHINKLIAILMIIAVIFTSIMLAAPGALGVSVSSSGEQPKYIKRFFDKEKVTQINIEMKQEDWDWIIENALQEQYRSANITINGETVQNVGIRPKGNSSLRTVAQNENSNRFSFKVEFDTYIKDQTLYGLDKLVLNNMFSDATYMKEYLSYDLFAAMGIVTPVYSFANITINGEPWGLYLMVEAGDKSFLKRNFEYNFGKLYKPEGTGSSLKWIDENPESYPGIFDNAAVKVTDGDKSRVIDMIKSLSSGTNLEKYIDADQVMRYFAVNTLLVNLDSYASNLKHNYYLYEKDGVCSIFPWDLNMSFAGFQAGDTQRSVDFSIDTPYTDSAENSPLISKLLEVPKYKELYYKYLDEAVKLYFDSELFETSIDKLDNLINSYVKNDATAFITYEQYEKSLPVLKEFGKLRAKSVTAQLAGASTAGTVSLDMSALGSMGGKGGMAGGMGWRQDNQGTRPGMGEVPNGIGGNFPPGGGQRPDRDNIQGGKQPGGNFPAGNQDGPAGDNQGGFPGRQDGMFGRDMDRSQNGSTPVNPKDLTNFGIITGISALAMTAGLIFAIRFKRRRYITNPVR